MNRELLEKPFPAEQIRQRKGKHGHMLDYVEGHVVIQRLNDALEGNWSFEIIEHHIMEEINEVLVLGKLTTHGIFKCQFGASSITRARQSGEIVSLADDLKAAATDSLKKCASLLGLGLSLYGGSKLAADGKSDQGSNVTPIKGGSRRPRNLSATGRLSGKQHNYIFTLAQEKGMTRQELNEYCIKTYGTGVDVLSKSDASALIETLRSGKEMSNYNGSRNSVNKFGSQYANQGRYP